MMESITLISVFIEGILSFISPCVLPLIPLYMSYLTSSCKEEDEEGNITYKTAKVIITTLCFVLGISTVFFILGISVDLIGSYIDEYRMLINIFGGIILALLALNGFGVINVSFINREHRLDTKTDFRNMNYFKAYLLGFIFSFAWTPCIGPMLSNVILLALSENAMAG
ncbi:MAG: cytochrome c biogenesis CcdA family protein, partial [Erysipelotrichaceae bacterium]